MSTPIVLSDITPAPYHQAVDADLFRSFGFGPPSTVPFSTIHEAFIHRATSHPSDTALIDHSSTPCRQLTYGELLRHSQLIAHHLKSHGVNTEDRVLLLVKRSAEMVAGILGILTAGAQYIPMDGNVVPDQTLQHAIKQSGTTVAVCLESFCHRLVSANGLREIVVLERLLGSRELGEFTLSNHRLLCHGTSDSGCYVIYTSGTTGDPKGVDVTHRNLTNILCQAPGNLGIGHGSRVGQVLSISFDMGAWEILGTITNGGTLVLRGSDWAKALREIDILICTPSILAKYSPEDFPNIKCVATAGEPSSQSLADRWASFGVTYYNCCGPTEITIINTMHRHTAGRQLSIGKPTPNNNVYILDGTKQPCRIGDVGTMWAGGAGVTRGYVGQPGRTAERFHYDLFVNDGSMMYNTGDLARWLPDGTLETFGRDDDQVKIKGFRVELDGVSASMASCPNVHKATALLVNSGLIGFITPKQCNTEEVTNILKTKLPYYAIPTRWHTLDAFLLTSNGKIDKHALAQLAEEADIPKKKMHPVLVEQRESYSSTTSTSNSIAYVKQEPVPLPEKRWGKPWRGLRYRIFIAYRTLFSMIWLGNIAILICLLTLPIDRRHISTIAFVNLSIAILVRQDFVINTFYTIFCSVPKSWPLWIRKHCAKIYHLGGVHSGAAVMAVAWYAGDICYNINSFATRPDGVTKPSVLTITLSLMALSIFAGMITMAYPTIRKKHHNWFERVHRFAGWTALAIIWVQTMSSIRDKRLPTRTLGQEVVRTPSFWMLIVITLSIATSWLFLRTVPVDAEVLSNHAVRLHFDYTIPVMGTFTRLSRRPLIEWHSFATVPAPRIVKGRPKGYSLVVSRAGDWTGNQISKPPTKLWVRGVPTCGVMRIATLFTRLVLVATGSGIGPLLGHIQVPSCPFRLVWSTPNPEDLFGKDIVQEIKDADPGAIIHDTKKQGRPDLVKLTWNAVQEFGAEGVVIISNEKLTKKVVYGLETRGVPAFGAIWDS